MVLHGSTPRGLTPPPLSPFSANQGRFGRMFPVPDSVDFDPSMLAKLAAFMEAGKADVDNPQIAAGYTFLGQFIDHDLTFDPTSSLEQQNDPDAVQNFRTPLLELDSIYGSGPQHDRFLYQKKDPDLFLIGEDSNARGEDLPRNSEGTAIIGDPRNDGNLILSQLHLIFLKFHNAVVARLRQDQFAGNVFEEAQRIVRWHYQWIVVNEFLPRLVGSSIASSIFQANGGYGFKLFFHHTNQFGERFIPVEFSVAAYRFGHSQIRPHYVVNTDQPRTRVISKVPTDPKDPFSLMFADICNETGGKKLDAKWNVAWGRFFEMDNPNAAPNTNVVQMLKSPQLGKRIDTHLSQPLFKLPEFERLQPSTNDAHSPSLAFRDLLRGQRFSLPYGQWVAKKLSLSSAETLTLTHPDLASEAQALKDVGLPSDVWPLWFYILKEAEVLAGGLHLGPVGGHIVGETFASLLMGDMKSYRSQDPTWTPWTNQPFTIPVSNPNRFTMPDLIRFAFGPTDIRTGIKGGHKGAV